MTDSTHVVGVSKGHCGGWGPVYAPYCSCGWEEMPDLYRSEDQATKAAEWHQKETNMQATAKYVREGNELVCREPGGAVHLRLPDPEGYTIGYWIKPSPFDGTPPWEWVITNMDVTVVTGMSSGYTFTRASAADAVRRALRFWASLGYDVVDPDGVT